MGLFEFFRFAEGIIKSVNEFKIDNQIIYSYKVEYTYKNKTYISSTIRSNNKERYYVNDKVNIKIIDKKYKLVKILSLINEKE